MLDNITKKNIDDCRDVLVGKVPDPKSQIEQITLALIYKFMDDMDKEAVEKFKGKAKFFTGEYAKYGWRKLFDPSLSGQDMLSLYSEALEKLNTNPNIPELFRNIFKNAYLPYRDPATLKLFLKHINEFEYSHSEKLGDAFEYLLSVMGSQGDAGQFRTPRHIIDFVTACVNPQKNETVLDPACGTAGFLLSAYKHIINYEFQIKNDEDAAIRNSKFVMGLTPGERKKIGQSIVGYDISPDMVRLSLANMYLHGFATPQIHEYDTLSSEDRWQETFDVILANPPFMTPKGGIRPHKKFGVQANKAEVLFTDYIAEHLNSNGRAGIVVPNGIVATSQNAYKQLRKMLVQDSLIAVISLPAGVFQPYSGVKTSILILDKKLAKKCQHILFLKIENDGFDLGAQRREIDKNDLPTALAVITNYKLRIANDEPLDEMPSMATLVEKETVLANKDILLSAERYFETEKVQTEFELVKLGDERYFKIESGGTPSSEKAEYWNGNIHWATLKDLPSSDFITIINDTERKISELGLAKSSAKLLPAKSVLVSSRATIGRIAINKIPVATNQGFKNIIIQDFDKAIPEYIAFVLTERIEEMNEMSSGSTFKEISKTSFSELEIPLPPLSIQQQIVAEIEGYQKIIDGAKQIVNNYKPVINYELPITNYEMVELDQLCDVRDGTHDSPKYVLENGIPFVTQKNITKDGLSFDDIQFISREDHQKIIKRSNVEFGDIIISMIGANRGMSCVIDDKREFSIKNVGLIKPLGKINHTFLLYYLKSQNALEYISLMSSGGAQQFIGLTTLRKFPIPVPDIIEQTEIVKAIEEEMQLVNANKRLIEIFEKKIKEKIGEVWGG
ncbi:MAG: N-6 DNA methylase [Chitinophagales bacterium]|nr:N-6 DNA methylase [Chitinophagales bacterium]